MTQKGVVGPLRFDRRDAAFVASLIVQQTEGIDLSATPHAALPSFGRKLAKAVQRRRATPDIVVMWRVTRDEAEAGCSYLMLCSHEEVPQYLTNEQMDAVSNVAVDIAVSLPRSGPMGLSLDEMELRIVAWREKDFSKIRIDDPRWPRRLEPRLDREREYWNTPRQRPVPPYLMALLTPRRITGN